MKFKLDENLPVSAADVLTGCGHDADTVIAEGLTGAADPRVVAAATAEGRVLITLDRGMGISAPTRREVTRDRGIAPGRAVGTSRQRGDHRTGELGRP